MHDRLYRLLIGLAISLTVLWIGWSIYDSVVAEGIDGDRAYLAGNTAFEDGLYEEAAADFEQALRENPDHIFALRGKARSLLQMGAHEAALQAFDEAIRRAPDFAATYANRGILHDRMGHIQQAIEDYEEALRLDPELADGPGWLTRFLRNQAQRPPTIADRASYLRGQLSKPPAERRLRDPALDAEQRPYKL